MKRKRLALLLAVALTATSVDSTAMVASAADFTADPVVESEEPDTETEVIENPEAAEEAPEILTEEASEDTADIEFSDGDVAESEEETTDSPEIVEEVDSEEPELTSEDTNVDVVSDGQTSVVPDTGITEIEADGVYPVDIVEEDQRAWFSFTPKEDGVYEFYSTGTYDTEGYFFDSREYYDALKYYRSQNDEEHYNDQGGTNSNFKFSKKLNAGTTYYYCAKMWSDWTTGSFDVTLTKLKSVVPDEGVTAIDVDSYYTVSVEEADQSRWFSFTPSEDGIYRIFSTDSEYPTEVYFFDNKEDYIKRLDYYRWDESHYNGNGYGNFELEKKLNAGTTYYYCAKFYESDVTGRFNIGLEKLKSVVPDEGIRELALDTTYSVNIEEEEGTEWFSFTPEEDGEYIFYSIGSGDPEGYIFDSKDYGAPVGNYKYNSTWWDGNSGSGGNFKIVKTLKAGTTYYYCARMEDAEITGNFDVRLVRNKKVRSIQATLNTDKVPAEVPSGLSMDIQYTFTDDSTETVKLRRGNWRTENDALDISATNVVIRSVDDPDGYTYNQWSSLPAGQYKLSISLDDVESNELDLQAVNIEEAPSFCGEVHEGKNSGLKAPQDEYLYYKFTTSLEGVYNFSSSDDVSIVEKYTGNEYGSLETDYESTLKKETTYYICVSGMDIDEGTFDLNIHRLRVITGLSFTPARTIYSNALNYDDTRIWGNVVITYDDQTTWTGEKIDCTTGLGDDESNYIDIIVKNQDGDAVAPAEGLAAGTYTVSLQLGDIVSDPCTITVKDFNASDLSLLTEGTNKVKAGNWYVFKPDKTGIYEVSTGEDTFRQSWYYSNDEGGYDYFGLEDEYAGSVFEAGRSYPVYFEKRSDDQADELDYTIARIASPTKLTVTSRKPSSETVTFVKGIDTATFEDVTAEVLFEDGSKTVVSEYEDDLYGRSLNLDFCRKNDDGTYESMWYGRAEEGDYVYRIWYGRTREDAVYTEDIPVKIVSMADADATELKTGTQDIQNKDGKFLLRFRPEESGHYEISFNAPLSDVRVYDEEGKKVGMERDDYAIYTTLNQDITYYFSIKTDEMYKDLRMTTSLLTRPESMKSKAHKTSYIAGLDAFDADTIETEITYPDKTTRKVRNQEETNGYYLQYRATKEDGSVAYNGSRLSSGVWKVEPYLSASVATGTAVAVDIPAEGTEITATKLDLSKYPVIEENTETVVNTSERTIYAFRAQQEGEYVFEAEGGGGYVWFFRDDEDGLSLQYGSIHLEAGETCAVVTNLYKKSSEVKFKIKRYTSENPGEDEDPFTGKTLELSTGMRTLVKINEPEGKMIGTFTPEEDGYYVIWSEYNKDTEIDPWVNFGEDGHNWDSGDDDSGAGWNFRQVYNLKKGNTYYYSINIRSVTSSFYIGFDKFQVKEVQKIELQAKEGKDAANFSVLDDFWEYFDLKVTYTDESVGILDWDDYGRDAYENAIDREISTDGLSTDEELTYTIKFSSANWIAGKYDYEEKSQITLKRKGLAGLNQIKTGKTQELTGDSNFRTYGRFVFQAPDSGEYMVHFAGQDEESARAEMYTCSANYQQTVYLNNVRQNYEAEGIYSFKLEKGKWYVLDARASVSEGKKLSVTINRSKDIKTLELVKAPAQTTMLPNDVNAISLKGMEVKATYTDGSVENITYGKADSSGRYLQHNGARWLNAEKCRVYVRLGRHQVFFDVPAGSWGDVTELKVNQKTELTAYKGDMLTLKLNVAEDDTYTFSVNGGYVKDVAEAETGKTTEVDGDTAELQKDTLYHVHIHATAEKVTVNVSQGECRWEETSRKEATCTADGSVTETCSVHGETRTEVLPKLGHDLGNRQTTKAATCGAAGESARICKRCKGKFEKQTIKATGKHKFSSWKTAKAATVFAEGRKERTCSVCKKKETQKISKLKATLTLSGVAAKKTLPLKLKRSYKVNVQMAKGDSVSYWKSSNKKAVTVDKYGKITGKQAGKTAKITVKLRSGLTTWFNVKVQRTDVATTSLKLKNASTGQYMTGSVTLKAKQKLKVTPVIAPVTGTQKVTYTTSNKKVATVASNGQITANAKGTAYIIAKSGSKSVRIKVTVK